MPDLVADVRRARLAVPGELCPCGIQAATVFTGGGKREVGQCGPPRVAARPARCPFCGARPHVGPGGYGQRCPEYRLRPGEADEVCGGCRRPFDASDAAFDGRARHRNTRWCRSCVDRCHESTDVAHACVICEDGTDE